jgi:hypothetical protein
LIVLDTTVLIDHLRRVPAATRFLESLTEPPAASEVVRVEINSGLRSPERASAERLFGLIDWLPVGEPVARAAGELGRRYRRSHPGIGVVDLIVAATALHLGADLATMNVRHFPMFRALRPPY